MIFFPPFPPIPPFKEPARCRHDRRKGSCEDCERETTDAWLARLMGASRPA